MTKVKAFIQGPNPGRPQMMGEEIANSISHGVALLLAAAGFPILVTSALGSGAVSIVIGVTVYAASLVLLYLASTVYHLLPKGRAKEVFRVLDHAAIFLMIAGTYTPFTLGILRGVWGWTLFGLIWGMALIGVVLKARAGAKQTLLTTAPYLVMGWLIVVAIKPLTAVMPAWGLAWLVAGGLCYTFGVIFYVLDRIRYLHFVWHLFVIAGTACHFVAVLLYSH